MTDGSKISTLLFLEINLCLKGHIPDYFDYQSCKVLEDKIVASISYPVDEWLYSLLFNMVPHIRDAEPASFERMEAFATSIGKKRKSKLHKEIYVTDPSKLPAEKLKTTLRIWVDKRSILLCSSIGKFTFSAPCLED